MTFPAKGPTFCAKGITFWAEGPTISRLQPPGKYKYGGTFHFQGKDTTFLSRRRKGVPEKVYLFYEIVFLFYEKVYLCGWKGTPFPLKRYTFCIGKVHLFVMNRCTFSHAKVYLFEWKGTPFRDEVTERCTFLDEKVVPFQPKGNTFFIKGKRKGKRKGNPKR